VSSISAVFMKREQDVTQKKTNEKPQSNWTILFIVDRLIDYSLTSSADNEQYFCYFHEKNMIITDTKSVMGGTYGCLF
jgi:hypothetical protein